MPKSTIDWSATGEAEFNRTVEALLLSEVDSSPGLYARAIDGRGGDDGIDVDVRSKKTDQLVHIYQLKWFREGFSGQRAKTRRDQIRHSFERAMELDPPVWTLVVPSNGTIKERQFVGALRKQRKVRITFTGAAELDLLLAKFPRIHDFATRDAALEALRLVGRESAGLGKPQDLGDELTLLHSKVDARSTYWTFDTSTTDGQVSQVLRAKRPDAQEREPLSINAIAELGPDHAKLREAFELSMKYGVSEPVTLPAEVIKKFELNGPTWFAGNDQVGDIRLLPVASAAEGKTVRLSAFNSQGARLGQLAGKVIGVTEGTEGMLITLGFDGGMVQRWKVPREGRSASTGLELNFGGQNAHQVRRILAFVAKLDNASDIEVEIDGQKTRAKLGDFVNPITQTRALNELSDDLDYLERELDLTFVYPEEMEAVDRVWLRAARLMLEGKVVLAPSFDNFTATLSGIRDEGLVLALTEKSAIRWGYKGLVVEVFGATLEFDDVSLMHHSAAAIDGAAHLDAVERGQGEGRVVVFAGTDGTPPRMFIPELIAEDLPLVPVAWGIPDIVEHAQLAAVQKIAAAEPPFGEQNQSE